MTKFLPEGASSIVVSKHTGETWQVFTEVSFRGATVNLQPGRIYEYPSDMGLLEPVKSFRKAPQSVYHNHKCNESSFTVVEKINIDSELSWASIGRKRSCKI